MSGKSKATKPEQQSAVKREDRRQLLLEGVAAQLYAQSGGLYWHLIREDVREEWRRAALGRIGRDIADWSDD